MVEEVFSHAEDFDLIHFHTDYLHFSRSRRERECPASPRFTAGLDIPDLVPLYKEYREVPVVSISDAQREPSSWVNWVRVRVPHGMPGEHVFA